MVLCVHRSKFQSPFKNTGLPCQPNVAILLLLMVHTEAPLFKNNITQNFGDYFCFRGPAFFSQLSTYRNTNFDTFMKHSQISYPLINGELLTSYFEALVGRNLLPPPERKIRGKNCNDAYYSLGSWGVIILDMLLCFIPCLEKCSQSQARITVAYSAICNG